MENSKIEWTHHTFNPWIGCTKVSDGCKNCYAETLMDHRYGRVKWGPQGERQRTSPANWRKPLQWNKQAEAEGRRYRVFCASLADVFEDRAELAPWRSDLFALIDRTPNLDWLLLTKRPENVGDMVAQMTAGHLNIEDWDNIWIGTSVEDQAAADKRIPHLLRIPAKVRFLSMEPLLGPVDLRSFEYPHDRWLTEGHDWLTGEEWQHSSIFGGGSSWLTADDADDYGKKRIHWVIVGGESGQNARPMDSEWVRQIRDQCKKTGVPFLFKQWGGVNKKAAGRLLDGVEYSEFPQ
jgi:protein gp37